MLVLIVFFSFIATSVLLATLVLLLIKSKVLLAKFKECPNCKSHSHSTIIYYKFSFTQCTVCGYPNIDNIYINKLKQLYLLTETPTISKLNTIKPEKNTYRFYKNDLFLTRVLKVTSFLFIVGLFLNKEHFANFFDNLLRKESKKININNNLSHNINSINSITFIKNK